MAKKKFRIVPNPKSDLDLLDELKRLMGKGIWQIENLAALLHVGRRRLHRLLGMFVNDYCSKNDDKVKEECKKVCSCKAPGKKAACRKPDGDRAMIFITRLPARELLPEFIAYMAENIRNAINMLGL